MRKLQMYDVSRHIVNTTRKKYVEQFCIYKEIDLSIEHERSLVDEKRSVSYGLGADISFPPYLIGGRQVSETDHSEAIRGLKSRGYFT